MIPFEKFAKELAHPLVLIGFVLLIIYYIIRTLLKAKVLTKLSKPLVEKIVKRIINVVLTFGFIIIILGFTLKVLDIVYTQNEKQDVDVSVLAEEAESEKVDEEDNNKYMEFFPIKDLDKKLGNFSFNCNKEDSLNLIFKSKCWDFDTKFSVSGDFLIKNLKSAIISHFKLKEYIIFKSYGGDLKISWLLIANQCVIEDENQTLIEAGIKNNDEILIRIIAEYSEKIAEEELEEAIE